MINGRLFCLKNVCVVLKPSPSRSRWCEAPDEVSCQIIRKPHQSAVVAKPMAIKFVCHFELVEKSHEMRAEARPIDAA